MKDKTTILLVVMLLAALALFAYFFPRETKPIVNENGGVNGIYSIKQIMSLKDSYVCKFESSDDMSAVAGTVHTDGQNIYGEFRILSATLGAEFNSYLLTRENKSYVWTSLQPVGQISKIARSASVNASPKEQAQIIGKEDKMQIECKPWQNDPTVFDIPNWINFVEVE